MPAELRVQTNLLKRGMARAEEIKRVVESSSSVKAASRNEENIFWSVGLDIGEAGSKKPSKNRGISYLLES